MIRLNFNFQTLLGDTLGCLIFSDFLEDEFSSENLHFLLAAYAFSKTQGQIEMRTKAELLINSYILGWIMRIRVFWVLFLTVKMLIYSSNTSDLPLCKRLKFNNTGEFTRSDRTGNISTSWNGWIKSKSFCRSRELNSRLIEIRFV